MDSTDLLSFASRHDGGLSEALVRRGQLGDRAAVGELFVRYRDRILRIIRARMGPALANAVDPEDVLQETYVRALAAFDRLELRHEGSIIAWFARIAGNVVLENAKRRAGAGTPRQPLGLPGAGAESGDGQGELLPGADLTPSEIARATELQTKIDEAVNGLTEEQRELVVLRFYEECDWRHIVEKLDLGTEGAAQMRLTRAKVRLGAVLGRYLAERGA